MLDGLLSEIASGGRTVVMTSHDLSRAAKLADRVDILSRGVIAQSIRRDQPGIESLPEIYREATQDD